MSFSLKKIFLKKRGERQREVDSIVKSVRERMSLTDDEINLFQWLTFEISPQDQMYEPGEASHYFSVGISAIRCIQDAMRQSRINSFSSILDMPCGHGRVLRFLRQSFPKARLTGCDLNADGVNFCHRRFGSERVYSQIELDNLSFGRKFDLIWCGSLATHLDSENTLRLLRLFQRSLVVGGLAVFTMHGQVSEQKLRDNSYDYSIGQEKVTRILKNYDALGYGYEDYPSQNGYGISLTKPEWIRSRLGETGNWSDLFYQPHGWDNHQDVYSIIRSE